MENEHYINYAAVSFQPLNIYRVLLTRFNDQSTCTFYFVHGILNTLASGEIERLSTTI